MQISDYFFLLESSALESEAVVVLPTAQFRSYVRNKVGSLYDFLLSHYMVAIAIVAMVILFFILRTIKVALVKKRAKTMKPESTNDWFSWEDFKKWQESQERQKG